MQQHLGPDKMEQNLVPINMQQNLVPIPMQQNLGLDNMQQNIIPIKMQQNLGPDNKISFWYNKISFWCNKILFWCNKISFWILSYLILSYLKDGTKSGSRWYATNLVLMQQYLALMQQNLVLVKITCQKISFRLRCNEILVQITKYCSDATKSRSG